MDKMKAYENKPIYIYIYIDRDRRKNQKKSK